MRLTWTSRRASLLAASVCLAVTATVVASCAAGNPSPAGNPSRAENATATGDSTGIASSAPAGPSGKNPLALRVDGNHIVNSRGQVVRLIGFNNSGA